MEALLGDKAEIQAGVQRGVNLEAFLEIPSAGRLAPFFRGVSNHIHRWDQN